MKAILMSIKPKWCELIFGGEKTIEVRKTAPKLKPPFKVYMYETQGATVTPWVDEDGHFIFKGRGQVVGEFVCDSVVTMICAKIDVKKCRALQKCERYSAGTCLTAKELYEYSKGDWFYGWHITNPKRYDTPKELNEFRKPDVWYKTETDNISALVHETRETITRAPQSWCYVEEIEE